MKRNAMRQARLAGHIGRTLVRVEAVTLLALIAVGLLSGAASIKKGPYLVYQGDARAMTVQWEMDSPVACAVSWGAESAQEFAEAGKLVEGSFYTHTFTGLTPATKYSYQIHVGGAVLAEGDFFSPPDQSALDLSFLVYGDTRSSQTRSVVVTNHNTVCKAMLDTFPLGYQTFALHVGDWVLEGGQARSWAAEIFSQKATHQSIREFLSRIPVLSCIGNHEWYTSNWNRGRIDIYKTYWPFPFAEHGYWSFDYGPVHVSVLDQYSQHGLDSQQIEWLKSDLAVSTKGWKFILLHDPGWSAGKIGASSRGNNTQVQELIQPICKEYGVSIVFGGHNHYYARAIVDGVWHVTSGGGGAQPAVPDMSFPYLVTAAEEYQFCTVDISGDTLLFKAITADGRTIDSGQLVLSASSSDTSSVLSLFEFLYWIGVVVSLGALLQGMPWGAGLTGLNDILQALPKADKSGRFLGDLAVRFIPRAVFAIAGPLLTDEAFPARVTHFMEWLPVSIASFLAVIALAGLVRRALIAPQQSDAEIASRIRRLLGRARLAHEERDI